jgi:beta-glucosidase
VYRVAATAKRTVVVVNAATPVLMPSMNDVDAVTIVALPGQEGGNAVAAVLTGNSSLTGALSQATPRPTAPRPRGK